MNINRHGPPCIRCGSNAVERTHISGDYYRCACNSCGCNWTEPYLRRKEDRRLTLREPWKRSDTAKRVWSPFAGLPSHQRL